MRRLAWGVCGAAGAAAAALAWIAAGLVGPFATRSIGAAALVAASVELCARRPARALIVGLGVALATAAAVVPVTGSLLYAWPVAGLGCGIGAATALPRSWSWLVLVVLTPALASCAFGFGALVVATVGFAANDARVLDQVLLGGAVGFGFCTGAFVPWLSAWCLRRRTPARVVVS